MKNGAMALLIGLLSLIPWTGAAAASLVDYVGYSYETGGFPPSNAGDDLNFLAVISGISAPLSWDPETNEYTIHISQLESPGQVQEDATTLRMDYGGGLLDIFEDPQFNAQPGQNPPNAVAPSTYRDGTLYLAGTLSNFVMYYNTQYNVGSFEARLAFNNGSNLAELGAQTSGYTFGGVFLFGPPPGYDLQWDGQILLDPVLVQPTTWGGIKAALRR